MRIPRRSQIAIDDPDVAFNFVALVSPRDEHHRTVFDELTAKFALCNVVVPDAQCFQSSCGLPAGHVYQH